MSRTYTSIINQDFDEVKNLIKSKTTNYKLDYKQIFKELELFHSYFYKFRDVLEQLDYKNPKAYCAVQEGVEGIFDFIWLIISSRYKSCIITFRSSIEMLVKGLMREHLPDKETNRFSNNIEIIIKQLRLKVCANLNSLKDKRKLKKFLEENYTYKIRELYSDLSEIVHGKYTNKNKGFSQYLEEITQVSTNYNKKQYNDIINESINLLKLMLELTIIINFKYLSENMNSYKLNLIVEGLSIEFKKFKCEYLFI